MLHPVDVDRLFELDRELEREVPAVSSSEYTDIDPSVSLEEEEDVEAFLFLVVNLCGLVPFFAGDFSFFL